MPTGSRSNSSCRRSASTAGAGGAAGSIPPWSRRTTSWPGAMRCSFPEGPTGSEPRSVAVLFTPQGTVDRREVRWRTERNPAMSSPEKTARPTSADLSPAAGIRTGLSVADLKQSFLDHLFCGLGRVPAVATRNDAYTALALTVRDRVLKQGVRDTRTVCQGRRARGRLSVRRVPARPAPGQQPPQPRHHRAGPAGAVGAGREPGRPDRAGGGARPGKRRPRPARVVLPGFARLAGSSRGRLRHSLRVRDLRPDHHRTAAR